MLREALDPAVVPSAGDYPAYARGGFADGLYDGDHIAEILQLIDSIGMAGFQSAFDLGRFRVRAYGSFANQEIANYRVAVNDRTENEAEQRVTFAGNTGPSR